MTCIDEVMKLKKKKLFKDLIQYKNLNLLLQMQQPLKESDTSILYVRYRKKNELKRSLQIESQITKKLIHQLFTCIQSFNQLPDDDVTFNMIPKRLNEFYQKVELGHEKSLTIFSGTLNDWKIAFVINNKRQRLLQSLTLIEGIMNRLIGFQSDVHNGHFGYYWGQFFKKVKKELYPNQAPFITTKIISLYFDYRNPIAHAETLPILSDVKQREPDQASYITYENIEGLEALAFDLLKLNPDIGVCGINFLMKGMNKKKRAN